MELIVRHRDNKLMHSGICVKQEIVNGEAPSNALDISGKKSMIPICICYVVWNQQIVSEEGEISYPDDNQRFPAICLHYASELIFEGVYNKEDDQDNDEDDEYKLVGEYLEDNHPDLFEEIIKNVNSDENESQEENTDTENNEVELVDTEEQKLETV